MIISANSVIGFVEARIIITKTKATSEKFLSSSHSRPEVNPLLIIIINTKIPAQRPNTISGSPAKCRKREMKGLLFFSRSERFKILLELRDCSNASKKQIVAVSPSSVFSKYTSSRLLNSY